MAQVVSDAQRTMGQVTAMAMFDDEFRARLEAAPLDVLREFGMDLDASTRVEIVSDPAALTAPEADGAMLLFIPQAIDLSEEELSSVAGAVASCQTTASTACTALCISCASSASSNSCS